MTCTMNKYWKLNVYLFKYVFFLCCTSVEYVHLKAIEDNYIFSYICWKSPEKQAFFCLFLQSYLSQF